VTVGEPSGTLDFHPIFCNHRYMNKTKFDSNGIFASTPELSAIALQVLEQEKRERELRREWFSKWNESQPADGGQWGIWHISDRD